MERRINWGSDAGDATYRTGDVDGDGSRYVVAETTDGSGNTVDVLLEWDDTAGEWVQGGPVNMDGSDITNAGTTVYDASTDTVGDGTTSANHSSVDAVEALLNGPLPTSPSLASALDVVTTDDNRGIRVQTTTTSDATENEPGRRGGITGLYPDGMEMWRLTGDAAEGELSLYGNTDSEGSGASSVATTKLANLTTVGPTSGWDISLPELNTMNAIGEIQASADSGAATATVGPAGSATDDAQFRWKDDTGAAAYRAFYDGSQGGTYRIQDVNNNVDLVRYISGTQRMTFPATRNNFPPNSSPPGSPSNGDIAYADGSGWDPGSGEGFYGYEAGAWVKL